MKNAPFGDDALEVVRLPPGFDAGGFSCRERELCDYLLDGDAARDHNAGVAKTYIVRARASHELVAYFTVLADSIKLDEQERPTDVRYVTAPAIKLGRIAVDTRFAGRGVGDFVLKYVVGLGRSLADQIGLRYVTLDALDRPTLIERYERFGFVRNVAPAVSEDGDPSTEVSMRFDLRD